jgi:hypothetical protein
MPTAFTVCLNQRAERRDVEAVWQRHFNGRKPALLLLVARRVALLVLHL